MMKLKTAVALLPLFASSLANAGASDLLADVGRAAQRVADADHEAILVLAPGVRLNVGDRIVRVSGHDKCPRDWMDKATGKPALEGCTVLDRTPVSVNFDDRTEERWAVKKDGDRTYLMRPNGVQATQAQ